jgi:hypothetical protein
MKCSCALLCLGVVHVHKGMAPLYTEKEKKGQNCSRHFSTLLEFCKALPGFFLFIFSSHFVVQQGGIQFSLQALCFHRGLYEEEYCLDWNHCFSQNFMDGPWTK